MCKLTSCVRNLGPCFVKHPKKYLLVLQIKVDTWDYENCGGMETLIVKHVPEVIWKSSKILVL